MTHATAGPSQPEPVFRLLNTIFTVFHAAAFAIVKSVAPEPYIDEAFHSAQCQTYCRGRFTEWDDKITTPPGLYLASFLISKVGRVLRIPLDLCSLPALRALNMLLVCCVLPIITRSIYHNVHTGASKDARHIAGLLPAFPLLSFFGNLYYTDVMSTVLVLSCYLFALKKSYKLSALAGMWSVATRQTNIVWVTFILGVSVIRDVKSVDIVELETEEKSDLPRAWMISDPPAIDASFPSDYIIAIRQCIRASLSNFFVISPILLSFSPIFLGFVAFLIWNQGIVLGDKTNHIAGINLPQLFYCATFITGFGVPILLRWDYVRLFLISSFLNVRRSITFWVTTGLIIVVVHLNTYTPSIARLNFSTEHPFLLADNRHFVFYIWRRTVKFHPLARYAAAPLYYACGWFVLTTLSQSQSTLFVLGLVVCTSATIVPSPLLEFRYFILPYLFWRLHLSPALVSKRRGILEYACYELINGVTLWIFVNRPFEWASEPGRVQRFIW